MRRRDFIVGSGGAIVWPLAGRAQQNVKRIGLLHNTAGTDADSKAEFATLLDTLAKLGWVVGSNLEITYRYGGGDPKRMATLAKELVALKPDLLFARSTAAVHALERESTDIPIVFVAVSDPVGDGFAESLSRPGRNITGFTNVESSVASKWVELLKEVAPGTTQIEYIFNPQPRRDATTRIWWKRPRPTFPSRPFRIPSVPYPTSSAPSSRSRSSRAQA